MKVDYVDKNIKLYPTSSLGLVVFFSSRIPISEEDKKRFAIVTKWIERAAKKLNYQCRRPKNKFSKKAFIDPLNEIALRLAQTSHTVGLLAEKSPFDRFYCRRFISTNLDILRTKEDFEAAFPNMSHIAEMASATTQIFDGIENLSLQRKKSPETEERIHQILQTTNRYPRLKPWFFSLQLHSELT